MLSHTHTHEIIIKCRFLERIKKSLGAAAVAIEGDGGKRLFSANDADMRGSSTVARLLVYISKYLLLSGGACCDLGARDKDTATTAIIF